MGQGDKQHKECSVPSPTAMAKNKELMQAERNKPDCMRGCTALNHISLGYCLRNVGEGAVGDGVV